MLSKWDSTPRSRIAALARKGVPDRLRKEVWMLLADAQNAELEASYRLLSSQTSASESVIKWDLERTFPAHEKYREKDGPGQRELSRVNTVSLALFSCCRSTQETVLRPLGIVPLIGDRHTRTMTRMSATAKAYPSSRQFCFCM